MLTFGFAAPAAVADDPNPGNATVDNYALMDGSGVSKMGFQSSGTSNYLGGNSAFTVEMWIKPDAAVMTSQVELFSKTDMLQYEIYNGELRALFHDGTGWKSAINTGVKVRSDTWQHIAYVKNGTTFTLYINGVSMYSVTNATTVPNLPNNTSSYVTIGANSWNGSSNQSVPSSLFFAGGIDEVKIWTTARTAAELTTGMNQRVSASASGLASYWDFNGTTSATTLYDRTGLLNLTISGSPKPTYPDVKSTSTVSGYTVVTFPRSYLPNNGGWTVPAGVTSVDALVVGGGGGGAGNTSATYVSAGGGGGGGGAYLATALAVSDTVSVTVGTGGYGGFSSSVSTGTYAGQGSTSVFGSISGGGGGGAGNDSNASETRQNGLAGTAGGGGGGATNFLNASRNGSAGAGNSVTVGGTTYSGQVGYAGGAYISGLGTAGPGGGTRGAGNNGGSYVAGAGYTSSINGTSTTYGAGGGAYGIAGWSFSATTTTPGRGGDGSYNTSTLTNGAPGGPGVIILKYVIPSSLGAITIGGSIYKGVVTSISVTANSVGRVTFYANGKKIAKCISIATSGSDPFTATCSWKPAVRGPIRVSATFSPTNTALGTSSTFASAQVGKRTTTR
jgi:hypothetical protein